MDTERSFRIATALTLFASSIGAGCNIQSQAEKKVSSAHLTPTSPEITPAPFYTKTPTLTRTPIRTLTPTETKTSDFQATNIAEVEGAFVGEEITLEKIRIDEVWSFKALGIREEYIVGIVRNEEGGIETVVKNFNCEAVILRDRDMLSEREEVFLAIGTLKQWETFSVFEEMKATKAEDIGDIDMVVSKSFTLEKEQEVECSEYTASARSDDAFKNLLKFINKIRD